MAFQFTHRSGIEEQVRQMAREQIERALQECERNDATFGEVVHGLRRRCKKLRGLVRLVEPRFKDWKRENRTFRDAAGGLAGTRDAAVLVDTLANLLQLDGERRGGPRIAPEQGEHLRRWLASRMAPPPDGSQRKQFLGDFVIRFEEAGQRAREWSLSGRGFDQIGDGLEDTYRHMRDGMSAADAEQTPEALHAWRKQTKYHWHHVSLLQAAAPVLLVPRKASLDRLAETLGDHHNLAVLDGTLATLDDVGTVRAVIAERQAMLGRDAFALGRQLVAEKPAMLRDRFEQYWSLLPEKS